MMDVSKYETISIDGLVKMGNKSRETLLSYVVDVQKYVGKGNDIDHDFLETLFDALDELGWNPDEFMEEWGEKSA